MNKRAWVKALALGQGIGALSIAVLAATGCSQEIGTGEDLGENTEDLFLDGQTWPNASVNVCFDNADGNNPTLIAEAQRQLSASWSRASKLTFNGWAACNLASSTSGNFSTIALHFCGGSSTSSFCSPSIYDNGVRAVGAFRGVSSAFGRVSPVNNGGGRFTPGVTHVSLINDDTQAFKARFRYQVIHEFGHALGYRHEQDRPDNFTTAGSTIFCNQSAFKSTTGSNQTPFFDVDSVMDYCSSDPLTNSFPTMLSTGDVMGVRVSYARNPNMHGFMIQSDRNTGLAVNAFNGAVEGAAVRLHSGCTISNPDCTWTYERGMLVSDSDPSLAINAVNGAKEGTVLKLTRACKADNPDCTWTYKNGEFLSDRNPALAINAAGGAVHGASLVTTAACTAANPDCTWTMPNVMLSSHRDPSLAVNALNGAVNHAAIALNSACSPTNGDCTFKFTKGMLVSTTNSTLALNALNGAVDQGRLEVNNLCTSTNKDCTWTWKKGQIISDNTANGTLPMNAINGAVNLASLKLNKACTASNPDCVFTGRFAKP